jgi:hypothetical protein
MYSGVACLHFMSSVHISSDDNCLSLLVANRTLPCMFGLIWMVCVAVISKATGGSNWYLSYNITPYSINIKLN